MVNSTVVFCPHFLVCLLLLGQSLWFCNTAVYLSVFHTVDEVLTRLTILPNWDRRWFNSRCCLPKNYWSFSRSRDYYSTYGTYLFWTTNIDYHGTYLFWTTSTIDVFKNKDLACSRKHARVTWCSMVVVIGKMASNVEAPESWYLALLGFAEHFRTSSPPKIRLCVHCLQAVFQFKPPQRVEARTHLQLGSVLYHHTKNSELARSHLEKAVRRESLRKLDDGVRDALIGVSYSQMGKVVLLALDPDPFIISFICNCIQNSICLLARMILHLL